MFILIYCYNNRIVCNKKSKQKKIVQLYLEMVYLLKNAVKRHTFTF